MTRKKNDQLILDTFTQIMNFELFCEIKRFKLILP